MEGPDGDTREESDKDSKPKSNFAFFTQFHGADFTEQDRMILMIIEDDDGSKEEHSAKEVIEHESEDSGLFFNITGQTDEHKEGQEHNQEEDKEREDIGGHKETGQRCKEEESEDDTRFTSVMIIFFEPHSDQDSQEDAEQEQEREAIDGESEFDSGHFPPDISFGKLHIPITGFNMVESAQD